MRSRFEALNRYDQDKLEGARAAVIGLGATGSVIAEHLARHGVELVLIDRDFLETNDCYSSNLFTLEQCEKALPKAEALRDKLKEYTDVEAFTGNFDHEKTEWIEKCDILLDGTDNLETRLEISEAAADISVPWIYTAALGERGFSMFVEDICFRCMFEGLDPESSCEANGVMREVSSIAASKSSLKAVKHLTGLEVEEKLEVVPNGREIEPGKCECGGDIEIQSSSVCGENKYQVFGQNSSEDYQENIILENDYLRKVEYGDAVLTIFDSGRAIIEADSEEEARQIYSEASNI